MACLHSCKRIVVCIKGYPPLTVPLAPQRTWHYVAGKVPVASEIVDDTSDVHWLILKVLRGHVKRIPNL